MELSRGVVHTHRMLTTPPTDLQAIGKRLRDLRLALRKNQSQMAALVSDPSEVSPQSWNQWEKGQWRPNIDKAYQIRAATGCTIDWIYSGDTRSMPYDLMQRINDAGTQNDSEAS